MTSQPVEANVVLTADNTAYDQAMIASAGPTNDLGKSIDGLGQKINNLSKSAGKKLLGITAADVTLIGGATAAWASYEKQMSRLEAQAAIRGRTLGQERQNMKDYTSAVRTLRTEYGTTTAEASRLVEVLGKVTGMRQTRQLGDLSKVFVDMSKATGESSEGLASSVTNLQKVMGAEIGTNNTRKYADMFTYLSQQSNTSAQGLVDFTAQLAPLGQEMGLNQKQIAGFATAFANAGQEGLGASTVFTKITADITKSIATGSPEIKQYANLIGKSAKEFTELAPQEKILQIMEALQAMGPRAAAELNRMGLDGTRSMRSITAVINQAGGVRQALGMAEIGADSGAAAEGADAAMANLSTAFKDLRAELEMTAESMATILGPMVEAFVRGFEKIASNVNEVMQGPLGEFLQVVMGIVAPFTAGAGAMLLFAGALLKIASAFALVRNSASLGAREGYRGGGMITRQPDGTYGPGTGGYLGTRGQQIASGGSWFQRGMYNTGQLGGASLTGGLAGIRGGWQTARGWWNPEYVPPSGAAMSPLSWASRGVAGGVGYGLKNFINPQFDQMRYANPAQRTAWLGMATPGTGLREQTRLSRQMGAVATEEAGLRGVRQAELAARADPLLTNQERTEKLNNLKQVREETKERLNSARSSERVTRESVLNTAAQRELRQTTQSTTRGFAGLKDGIRGFVRGEAGALGGGLKAGAGAAFRSPMGAQLGAGLVMAGAAGAGIESNTLMMGAMGTMLMPGWGTAAGVAAGAALDLAQANNAVTDSIQAVTDQADEASSSGVGLPALSKSAVDAKKDLDDLNDSFTDYEAWGLVRHPQRFFGTTKNLVEGLLGSSDVEEAQGKLDKANASAKETESIVRDLARGTGTEITGKTRNARLAELDEFMNTTGSAKIAQAGYTFNDLSKTRQIPVVGDMVYDSMMAAITQPSGKSTGLWDRLRAGGGTGAFMLNDPQSRYAVTHEEDVPALYKAVNRLVEHGITQGKSLQQILEQAESAQHDIGIDKGPEYAMQGGVSSVIVQRMAAQAAVGTRVQGFQSVIGQELVRQRVGANTATDAAELESAKQATTQSFVDNTNYFKQLLLAQDQYELSRSRAQEDFHLQQTYQLQDYNISRQRAEESFNRMRGRAVADFHRSEVRALYDFHLQRERATEDYQHQLKLVGQQTAMAYDPFQRVEVQRTSSASWVLSNARDQLQRLRDMEGNLDKLRKLGFSDEVIQQLRFTDPSQAQQLSRFVSEVEDRPRMVGQFNRVMGQRQRAGRAIGTDSSSSEFQEMQRSFRLGMSRSAEDFERQMRLSRQDFRRGLGQQRQDFNIMMEDQAEDFARQTSHQEKAYKQSMDRSAEDMANMANEVSMSMEEVLVQSVRRLSGSARTQAQQVLKTFQDLKGDTRPEAIAIMKDLASIFGFEYKVPKLSSNNASQAGGADSGAGQHHGGYIAEAQGGVIPGWTPGRDVTTAHVSGGEAIMRPEWTRAVGEKQIDAWNHKARYGGFFLGGTLPLPGASSISRHSGYPSASWAGDLNWPGYADYGKPIVAWKSGIAHPFDYGRDYSYGRGQTISTTGGGSQLYAHMSKVITALAGKMVSAGQTIGYVGDYGNTGTPPTSHLHFEIRGGDVNLGDASTGTTANEPALNRAALRGVLKDRYPKSEAAAKAMSGVHPLFPGDISKVINRFARDKIRKLRQKYGVSAGASSEPGVPPAPEDLNSNQETVRRAMLEAGFNSNQWPSLYQLVMHESGFNNNAQNPTSSAYGMFQFLDSTWSGYGVSKTSDPWRQAVAGLRYIKGRYGSPAGAWDFWQDHNWYGNGSVFTGPQTIGVGENGPEAVIPLNARGGNFMAEVMGSLMGGRNTAPTGGGMSVFNTRIDRSTNFTGAITVQANDPMELMNKLVARKRVMALSRPSLTGSAA